MSEGIAEEISADIVLGADITCESVLGPVRSLQCRILAPTP